MKWKEDIEQFKEIEILPWIHLIITRYAYYLNVNKPTLMDGFKKLSHGIQCACNDYSVEWDLIQNYVRNMRTTRQCVHLSFEVACHGHNNEFCKSNYAV